jgi:dTDP-glucose 4,6-dehydratase
VPSKLDGVDKYEQLITYVGDRAGHDVRYAIDATKIWKELKWKPEETFRTGIEKTVHWYLVNHEWCKSIQNKNYLKKRKI